MTFAMNIAKHVTGHNNFGTAILNPLLCSPNANSVTTFLSTFIFLVGLPCPKVLSEQNRTKLQRYICNRFMNRTTGTVPIHAQTHSNPFGPGQSGRSNTPPSTAIRNPQTTHNPSRQVSATTKVPTTVWMNHNPFRKGPCQRLHH